MYNMNDEMFSKKDQQEILRLYKVVVATHDDMQNIFFLYKKYITPNAAQYRTDCNCGSSISAYYQKLLEWYSGNASKFDVVETPVKKVSGKKNK